eukprot:g2361.t1
MSKVKIGVALLVALISILIYKDPSITDQIKDAVGRTRQLIDAAKQTVTPTPPRKKDGKIKVTVTKSDKKNTGPKKKKKKEKTTEKGRDKNDDLSSYPCTDKESSCSDWAKSGECTKNPEYMRRFCRISCNLCMDPKDHMHYKGISNDVKAEDDLPRTTGTASEHAYAGYWLRNGDDGTYRKLIPGSPWTRQVEQDLEGIAIEDVDGALPCVDQFRRSVASLYGHQTDADPTPACKLQIMVTTEAAYEHLPPPRELPAGWPDDKSNLDLVPAASDVSSLSLSTSEETYANVPTLSEIDGVLQINGFNYAAAIATEQVLLVCVRDMFESTTTGKDCASLKGIVDGVKVAEVNALYTLLNSDLLHQLKSNGDASVQDEGRLLVLFLRGKATDRRGDGTIEHWISDKVSAFEGNPHKHAFVYTGTTKSNHAAVKAALTGDLVELFQHRELMRENVNKGVGWSASLWEGMWEPEKGARQPEMTQWTYGHLDDDIWAALQRFPNDLRPGTIGMDMGTYDGSQAYALAKLGFDIVGSDVSELAIHYANKELQRKKTEDSTLSFLNRVRFVHDDILDSGFSADTFDWIFDRAVLHNVYDVSLDRYLDSIRRILKPGGLLFVKGMSGSDPNHKPDFVTADGLGKIQLPKPMVFDDFTVDKAFTHKNGFEILELFETTLQSDTLMPPHRAVFATVRKL